METVSTITFWHWFGIAAALLIFELLGGGGFLLWTGISAAIVGILTWLLPHLTWQAQFFVFSCFTVISAWGWWWYLRKHPTRSEQPLLNQRAQKYVGRVYTLSEAIINGRGRVKVDDGSWLVECNEDLPANHKIKVISAEGTVLKVEKFVETK